MNRIVGLFLLLFLCGCSCPGTRTESSGSGDHPAGAPTAIRQSVSYIEAIIDSVVGIDQEHFQLAITLVAARTGSSGESLAEPGQRLLVAPARSADVLAKLSLLRTANRGDTFSGTLARSADGSWLLLDAKAR